MLYPACGATYLVTDPMQRVVATAARAVLRKAYKGCTTCVVRRLQLHTLCRGFGVTASQAVSVKRPIMLYHTCGATYPVTYPVQRVWCDS